MDDQAASKVCPLCAETIKAAAKVCSHCRHWQKGWSLGNPAIGGTLSALFFIMLMAGVVLLQRRDSLHPFILDRIGFGNWEVKADWLEVRWADVLTPPCLPILVR
jgi:hypothetical protein